MHITSRKNAREIIQEAYIPTATTFLLFRNIIAVMPPVAEETNKFVVTVDVEWAICWYCVGCLILVTLFGDRAWLPTALVDNRWIRTALTR